MGLQCRVLDMSDDANRPRQHDEMERADSWDLRRCHRAIRERIGQELERYYRLPQDLPHPLLALLCQLEAKAAVETGGVHSTPEDAASALGEARPKGATASSADPVFAAIEAHNQANLDWAAKLAQHGDMDHLECVAAGDREGDAYGLILDAKPTTVAGFAALFQYLQEPRWSPEPHDDPHEAETLIEYMMDQTGIDLNDWCSTIELVLRRIAATA